MREVIVETGKMSKTGLLRVAVIETKTKRRQAEEKAVTGRNLICHFSKDIQLQLIGIQLQRRTGGFLSGTYSYIFNQSDK